MDWWYLAPLALDRSPRRGARCGRSRCSAGRRDLSVPWWMRRRAVPARLRRPRSRCNACGQCYQDCPYNAISMVPRTDGHARSVRRAGGGRPREVRRRAESAWRRARRSAPTSTSSGSPRNARGSKRWVKRGRRPAARPVRVLFLCAESGAGALRLRPRRRAAAATLPGWRVARGAVRRLGALAQHRRDCSSAARPASRSRAAAPAAATTAKATIGCASGWTARRSSRCSARSSEGERVLLARRRGTVAGRALVRALERFARRYGAGGRASRNRSLGRRSLAGVASAPRGARRGIARRRCPTSATPRRASTGSELVVSFKHPGEVSEHCRTLSDEEKAALPGAHAPRRRCATAGAQTCACASRSTASAWSTAAIAPAGIWGDGNSVAVERIPVSPGEHRVDGRDRRHPRPRASGPSRPSRRSPSTRTRGAS